MKFSSKLEQEFYRVLGILDIEEGLGISIDKSNPFKPKISVVGGGGNIPFGNEGQILSWDSTGIPIAVDLNHNLIDGFNFLNLDDTPNTYNTHNDKILKVNSATNSVEFDFLKPVQFDLQGQGILRWTGVEWMFIEYSSAVVNSSLALRTGAGTIKASNAIDANDLVTLSQLTSGLSGKVNTTELLNYLRSDGDIDLAFKIKATEITAPEGSFDSLFLNGLTTASNSDILSIGSDNKIYKQPLPIFNLSVANGTGTPQFSLTGEDEVRFRGSGDASVSFDPVTKTVTITSTPGTSEGGDMLASVYDPAAVQANVYDRTNHTGMQDISTINNLTTILADKAESSVVSSINSRVSSIETTLPNLESVTNKSLTLSVSSTDTEYPSSKAVYTFVTGMIDSLPYPKNFLQLEDTPNNYTGAANRFLSVNSAGNGVVFRGITGSDFSSTVGEQVVRFVDGVLQLINVSDTAANSTLVKRTGTGTITANQATEPTEVVNLGQMDIALLDKASTDDLGTAAFKDFGNSPGQLVELGVDGKIDPMLYETSEGGGVVSVGLSMPEVFNVTNTPITNAGAFNVTLDEDYSIPTIAKQNEWDNKESTSNKVTSISATPNDTNYPSEKAVADYVSANAPADQVNSDWNATSGVAQILNKPTIGNGTLSLATGTGLTGSASFSANQSGAATFTVEAASGHTIPTTAQATNWTSAYDYSQIGHLELSGGTVTGQIKRTTDAVDGDDVPRLSQVQGMISDSGGGTVTSVDMSVPTGLTVSGNPITGAGTLAIGLETGYSIPTAAKQGEWDGKQDSLVSGTNIKTINGTTILGSGNIVTPNDNTTYTAGTGLTLSGTTFGQTITTSGTGTYVSSITQTTNGLQINLGTPPNTTYTNMSSAEITAGTATTGRVVSSKTLNDWLGGRLSTKADLVDGLIPASQLPSYVDDVLEGLYINATTFNDPDGDPYPHEDGKIYVDISEGSNKGSWRWTGTQYTKVEAGGVALGDTSSTAHRGDHGSEAYNLRHSHDNKSILDSISAGDISNWDAAFGWGGHEGLYRPVDWVPSWGDVTGKPSTFTPSAHTHNADDINTGILNIARIPTGSTGSTVALGNHTHTFASITSKPTTLSGYGIADAYTKTETDSLLGGSSTIPTYIPNETYNKDEVVINYDGLNSPNIYRSLVDENDSIPIHGGGNPWVYLGEEGEFPEWDEETIYNIGDRVIMYDDSITMIYEALVNSPGSLYDFVDWKVEGVTSLPIVWDSSTTYNLVAGFPVLTSHNGNYYSANQPTTGIEPGLLPSWERLNNREYDSVSFHVDDETGIVSLGGTYHDNDILNAYLQGEYVGGERSGLILNSVGALGTTMFKLSDDRTMISTSLVAADNSNGSWGYIASDIDETFGSWLQSDISSTYSYQSIGQRINNDDTNLYLEIGSDTQMTLSISTNGVYTQLQISKTEGNSFTDDINTKGLVYGDDYSFKGLEDDRWIPDLGAVKSQITWGNLIGKPTTISGFGLTDAYTKTEVDNLISGGGFGTVSSVAMTVPTGLSISGSPITSSGTLAVSLQSGYSIPTTAKQGEWDTAFGWGPHTSAGYLQSQKYKAITSVTSNITLAATHQDCLLDVTGTRTLTIPASLSTNFETGGRVDILIRASAKLNINGAAGVSLVHKDGSGNTSRDGFVMITIIRLSTNEYVIQGG